MKYAISTVIALALSSAAASAQQFYTSAEFEDFNANLPGASYTHTYSDPEGAVSSPYLVAGTNGIAWNLSAPSGLYSLGGGEMSHNEVTEALRFTFTGSDVYAFGGEFYGTELNGNILTADITFTTSTGISQIISTASASAFIGFISNQPLEWVEISANAGATNTWATTNSTVAAIPEPATTAFVFGGLAICAGLWWRRRIKTA